MFNSVALEFLWSYSPRMCSLTNEPFVEIVVNSVIMRKPLRQCGRITIPLYVFIPQYRRRCHPKNRKEHILPPLSLRSRQYSYDWRARCSAKTKICITIGSVRMRRRFASSHWNVHFMREFVWARVRGSCIFLVLCKTTEDGMDSLFVSLI